MKYLKLLVLLLFPLFLSQCNSPLKPTKKALELQKINRKIARLKQMDFSLNYDNRNKGLLQIKMENDVNSEYLSGSIVMEYYTLLRYSSIRDFNHLILKSKNDKVLVDLTFEELAMIDEKINFSYRLIDSIQNSNYSMMYEKFEPQLKKNVSMDYLKTVFSNLNMKNMTYAGFSINDKFANIYFLNKLSQISIIYDYNDPENEIFGLDIAGNDNVSN